MGPNPDSFFSNPTRLVLYLTGDEWRYAVYTEEGIADGRLPTVDGASPAAAQAALLELVQTEAGRPLSIAWRVGERAGWWAGDVA